MLAHRLKRIGASAPEVANTGLVLFGCGESAGGATWTYSLVTAAIATSTNVGSGSGGSWGFANQTYGLLYKGYNSSSAARFQISDMTTVTDWSIGGARDSSYTGSTSTAGYVQGGVNLASSLKYTYSSNTSAANTTLGATRQRGASHNNSTIMFGISGSDASNTTILSSVKVFTFSSETFGTDTSISVGRSLYNGASGDQTRALIVGGSSTWPDTYALSTEDIKFSDNSRTARTSISAGFRSFTSSGNDAHGLWLGGYRTSSAITATLDYSFITDTHAAGTNLLSARYGHGSFSTSQTS